MNTKNGKLVAEEKGVSGYQIIDNTPTKIYLYLETSQPPLRKGVLADGKVDIESKEGSAIALFYGSEKNLNLRYGISFISAEQAKKNLQRDITTYDVKGSGGCRTQDMERDIGQDCDRRRFGRRERNLLHFPLSYLRTDDQSFGRREVLQCFRWQDS